MKFEAGIIVGMMVLMPNICGAKAPHRSTYETKVFSQIRSDDIDGALKTLELWKAHNGEKDPQYWVAGGNVWYYKGREETVQITALKPGTYKMDSPSGESVDIKDPKTGKVVGAISDGPPKIDEVKVRKAIGFLDKGIALAPDRLDIYTGRATLYRSLGDLPGELKALRSMATDPVAVGGHFEDGSGQWLDESLEDYQVDMLNNYAREHFEKENASNDAAGVAVAKLLIELFPKRAQGYNLLAAAASYRKDWTECVAWLDKALQADPKDSLVLFNKAHALEELGQKGRAVVIYRRIIELNNDEKYVELAKGRIK
jgi:tetratricopeptide (TPR) repeat protein